MHRFGIAMQAHDIEAAVASLTEDVEFRSPVVFKPYQGRAAVAPLLYAVAEVLQDFRYTREIGTGSRDLALVFQARAGDRAARRLRLPAPRRVRPDRRALRHDPPDVRHPRAGGADEGTPGENPWRPGYLRASMARVSDQPQRWSQATVYRDMWVDPAEDPRENATGPEGERATLHDYLTSYRLTLLMKCEGLTPEQLARRSVPPSTMSLLGLLRHLAEVERDWRGWILPGDPPPKLYDADFDGAVAEQPVVDAAYADLAREQAATDAALAEHPDLSTRLGKDAIAVRDLLVHRVEEYARHCGHADLLRECVDGRVGQ